MEEQKHTSEQKLSIVDTYNNLSLCVKVQGDPKELRIANFYAYTKEEAMANAQLFLRAPELLEQLKQLKERNLELADELVQANQKLISYSGEVEQLKEENDFHRKNESDMVKSLTEQVENLKRDRGTDKLAITDLWNGVTGRDKLIKEKNSELSRLREREKESIEVLREALYDLQCVYIMCKSMPKIESLLSKVKQSDTRL